MSRYHLFRFGRLTTRSVNHACPVATVGSTSSGTVDKVSDLCKVGEWFSRIRVRGMVYTHGRV